MKSPIRIGLIEIGSRSLRLLVADVADPPHFHVLATDSTESRLAQAKDPGQIKEALSRIGIISQRWLERCEEMGVKKSCVFGTEGLRRVPVSSLKILRSELPGLRILSPEEEAACSLFAGGYSLPIIEQQGVVAVIDQGGASLEIAIGKYGAEKLYLQSAMSLPFGTQPLVAMLREANGDFRGLRKRLTADIRVGELKTALAEGRVVIQGSAATKLAWMSVRQRPDERYDPRRVQGVRAPVRWIDGLVATAQADPDRVRRAVDPKNPTGSEYETVMAGLIAVRVVLDQIGVSEFTVGSRGTRHGMAWSLAGMEPTVN